MTQPTSTPSTMTTTPFTSDVATTGATTGATTAAGRKSTAMAAHLGKSRWSDTAFLDGLRQFGDEAADRCAVELSKIDNSAAIIREVFTGMTQNDQRLPETRTGATQAVLHRHLRVVQSLPPTGVANVG